MCVFSPSICQGEEKIIHKTVRGDTTVLPFAKHSENDPTRPILLYYHIVPSSLSLEPCAPFLTGKCARILILGEVPVLILGDFQVLILAEAQVLILSEDNSIMLGEEEVLILCDTLKFLIRPWVKLLFWVRINFLFWARLNFYEVGGGSRVCSTSPIFLVFEKKTVMSFL